ncbi:hypothetical protein F5Y08DRAFT_345280 [Xylaria arbuscula]|nr:hypothetical protein F5Y08DRAFT_345280 [Xylaria arbuscula]
MRTLDHFCFPILNNNGGLKEYEIRREDGNFYPGILLPLVNLEGIGISGSVATLLQYTFDPMCYRYEGDQIAGWRDGYEDGGPLVDQRRHPVLLLDENQFPVPPPEARFELPERPVYEWAAARDFRGLPQSKVASMNSRFKNPVTLFRERLQAVISEGGTKRVAGRVKASKLNDGQASPLAVKGSSAGNDA